MAAGETLPLVEAVTGFNGSCLSCAVIAIVATFVMTIWKAVIWEDWILRDDQRLCHFIFVVFHEKKLFYTHFQLSIPTSSVLSSYIHTPSETFWSFLHRAFITAWPGESPKPNSAGTDRVATHGGFYWPKWTGSMTRWHNRRKWGTPQPQAIWLFVETGETLEELLWGCKFLYDVYSPPWVREKAGTERG